MSVNSEQRLAVQLDAAKRLIAQFETGAGRHNSSTQRRSNNGDEGAGVREILYTIDVLTPTPRSLIATLGALQEAAHKAYKDRYSALFKPLRECAIGDLTSKVNFLPDLRGLPMIAYPPTRPAYYPRGEDGLYLYPEPWIFQKELVKVELPDRSMDIGAPGPYALWFSHFKRIA